MGESGSSSSATSLAPGFRFHPTDEELVSYYLKRKICGKPFRFDAISDIDIYKAEPWELPGRSKLKSRDLEWYFFSALDKKYGNGARTNRATVEGYWKTTGKDRPVYHRSHVVGMKKTLVYHRGRAPRGARSNWVMHEYRLTDEDLAKARISQDAFVLCRIFQKSGSGPKNGEQYGAPYLEEEWEDDNVVAMVPGQLPAAEGFTADDLLDQSLHVEFPTENAPAALKICQEDTGSNSGNSRSLSGSGQRPLAAAIVGENPCYSGLSDDQKLFNPCMQPELDTNTGKNEYIIDSNNVTNHTSTSYLPVLPRLDIVNNSQAVDNAAYNSQAVDNVPYNSQAVDNVPYNSQAVDNAPYNSLAVDNAPYNSLAVDNAPYNTQAVDYEPFDDGLFLEANDLLPPAENDPSYFGDKFDELLAFMDQEDDIEQYFDFDSLGPMANDFTVADDAFLTEENLHNEAERMPQANQQLPGAYADDGGSCSKPAVEVSKSKCELEYPFINRVLGNIPAPPAFAAEFPTKNLAARLNAASDSIHFTAGMVRVRNSISDGNGMQWFMGKDGSMNVVLSFVVPESVVSPIGLDYLSGVLRCKTASAVTRSLFYFFFFWVLVLAISAKIGTCIYAK